MIDPIVLVQTAFVALAAAFAARLRWMKSAPWPVALEAAAVLLAGLLNSVFAAGHLIGVTAPRLDSGWAQRQGDRLPSDLHWILGFPYDLRFYAMTVFGVILLVHGATCIRSVPGVVAGQFYARSAALRSSLWLAGLTLPVCGSRHYCETLAASALLSTAVCYANRKRARRERLGRVVAVASGGR